MPGGLKWVSVGADGTVWGVNSNDNIFKYSGNDQWQRISGALKQIDVGSAEHVWGVNARDEIYRWTGNGWEKVPGSLTHVSVGADGAVWGLNRSNEVFRYSDGQWNKEPGAFKQIDVGKGNQVWGVSVSGELYRLRKGSWRKVPGRRLAHVSVGADGAVWGVTSGHEVFQYSDGKWSKRPGALTQIDVGRGGQVWGVDAQDQIYQLQEGAGQIATGPGRRPRPHPRDPSQPVRPDDDRKWGEKVNSVPRDERLVILQYNTHLFEGSKAPNGQKIIEGWTQFQDFWTGDRSEPPDPLLFADTERRNRIAEKLRTCDADVITLNEVWSDANKRWFVDQLKDVYPYSALGKGEDAMIASSGLVLLSKFEILDTKTYIFDRPRTTVLGTKMGGDFEEDSWANKGVLLAVIAGPGQEKIAIAASHTAGLVDIAPFVEWTERVAKGVPAKIMVGDLNVHEKDRSAMNAAFASIGARDAWTEVRGKAPGYNINFPKNKLDPIFAPHKYPKPDDQMQVDRLDCAFYTRPLKPVAARVIYDWTFPHDFGYYQDIGRRRWQSNYVAVRSFELNGHPYLFGLKQGNDRAYISKLITSENGVHGWQELGSWEWQSNYVGNAVRTFELNGHPYIFALKQGNDRAYISRINDDGRGWTDLGSWKWQSNYVAIVPFYLNGHPYLFGLKQGNDRAYISRINDDGRGWTDLGSWKWQSNYVGSAITIFELNGHPYIFALKQGNDRAYISRINDDGRGWRDLGSWMWQSNYVAVVSYQLGGHPYLFGLKNTGEAFVSRINDDGHGWKDVSKTKWDARYCSTCFAPFYVNTKEGVTPYLFSLKYNDEGWITKLREAGPEPLDLSDHYPLEVVFRDEGAGTAREPTEPRPRPDSGTRRSRSRDRN